VTVSVASEARAGTAQQKICMRTQACISV
jgi:hypothetical protein